MAPRRPPWLERGRRRLLPAPDTEGPRIRLGVAWFLLVILATVAGLAPLAFIGALTAAVAALQTCARWRQVRARPSRAVAALAAAALPSSAAVADWALGVAILAALAASVVLARGDAPQILRDGGLTVRCWLPAGIAAASVVVLARTDTWLALSLLLLVGAYDSADFLFSAGSRWSVSGPVAGALAVGVCGFAVVAVAFPPLDDGRTVVLSVATALAAPLGQALASLALPDGRAPAPALRRLDTLLAAGPVWVGLWWAMPTP